MSSLKADEKVHKFKVIDMGNTCYIQNMTIRTYSSFDANIEDLLFNGEKAKKTNKERWYEVKFPIESIKQKQQDAYINKRWELKEGFPVSDLTPKVILDNDIDDTIYSEVSGLYSRKYDIVKGDFEDVKFELEVISKESASFKFPDKKNYEVSYWLLDEIESHPDLLFKRPCTLGGERLYNIVGEYLKTKVDPRYAILETGYSWRIKVSKRLKLVNPYTTRYDANAYTKKRKSDWREKYIGDKTVDILLFENSSSTKIYPPTIYGENLEDLDAKLTEYLEGLVSMINEPYCECKYCNGYGVIKESGELLK